MLRRRVRVKSWLTLRRLVQKVSIPLPVLVSNGKVLPQTLHPMKWQLGATGIVSEENQDTWRAASDRWQWDTCWSSCNAGYSPNIKQLGIYQRLSPEQILTLPVRSSDESSDRNLECTPDILISRNHQQVLPDQFLTMPVRWVDKSHVAIQDAVLHLDLKQISTTIAIVSSYKTGERVPRKLRRDLGRSLWRSTLEQLSATIARKSYCGAIEMIRWKAYLITVWTFLYIRWV